MIEFETCIKNGNQYLFFARNYNMCVSCDEKFDNWAIVTSLPEEKFCSFQLCRKMFIWNQYLIFVPYEARKINILNLDTKEWNVIDIKADRNKSKRFIGAQLLDDKLWLFGSYYMAIVCINLNTLEIEYFTDLFVENIDGRDMLFRGSGCIVGDSIYNPMAIDNAVCIINFKDRSVEKAIVGLNNKYSGICYDGNNLWLSPRNDEKIVCVDKNLKIIKEYDLPSQHKWGELTFSGVYKRGNSIFFPSFQQCYKSVEIDCISQRVTVKDKAYFFVDNINDGTLVGQQLDGTLVLFEGTNETEYLVGLERDDVIQYLRSCEEKIEFMKEVNSTIIRENDIIGLEQFIHIFGW